MGDICVFSESAVTETVGLSGWGMQPDALTYHNNEVIGRPTKPMLAIQVRIWFVIQIMGPSLFNQPVLTG